MSNNFFCIFSKVSKYFKDKLNIGVKGSKKVAKIEMEIEFSLIEEIISNFDKDFIDDNGFIKLIGFSERGNKRGQKIKRPLKAPE